VSNSDALSLDFQSPPFIIYQMKIKFLPLYLVFFCISVTANAEFPRSEVLLNGMQASLKAGTGTALSVTAGYNFTILKMLQIGFSGDVLYTNVANIPATTFDILVGPTLNIPLKDDDFENAIFIDAMAGMEIQTVGLISPTWFIAQANLGKRFEIIKDLSYRPDIGVQVINGAWSFVVRALAFSFMF
jgi:hypothetical protein